MTEDASPLPRGPSAELDRALGQLSDLREQLLARVESLPEEAREVPPPEAPTTWSPTQVLHHLYLVEAMVLERMPEAGEGLASVPSSRERDRGVGTRIRHTLGALAVRVVFRLGLRVRVPTQRVSPDPTLPYEEAASAWRATGKELASRLEEAFARAPMATTMRHPVSGPLTAEGTARFLLEHARHHARQLDRLGVPRAPTD